jgi:uncharacterized protein YkwD
MWCASTHNKRLTIQYTSVPPRQPLMADHLDAVRQNLRSISQPTQNNSFTLKPMRFRPILLLIAALGFSGCGNDLSGITGKGSGPARDSSQGSSDSSKPLTPAPTNPAKPDPIAPAPISPPAGTISKPAGLSFEAQTALDLVNAARSKPQNCGGTTFPAVPALTWNSKLEAAARFQNQDMIAKQYFDHVSPDGSTPASRVRAQGYDYAWLGENIAVGSLGSSVTTVAGAIKGWLASPGHCKNIMNPNFIEMGLASASGPWEQFDAVYWTQEFGQPR